MATTPTAVEMTKNSYQGSKFEEESVNLKSGSLGMVHLNDEVYGSNCGRCPVFIHDLLYSP
jgi:hypothetical protein